MKGPWSCSACGKKFRGLSGFEAHRVGDYADIAPHYGRRCLEDAEFEVKGYHQQGELWSKAMTDKQQAALEKLKAANNGGSGTGEA